MSAAPKPQAPGPATPMTAPARHITKTHVTLAVAGLLWLAVEAAAQWRSHIRFGQSVWLHIRGGGSDDQVNPLAGLRLFRPNARIGGSEQSIQTNSQGLRSPEIPFDKPAGSVRIAVLGASTVMGAYARSNVLTFPAQLEARLRQAHPGRRVDVINAGYAGLALQDQAQLYRKLVQRYRPDTVIVYAGINDFAAYCQRPAGPGAPRRRGLTEIKLPPQWLSVELLVKNTIALREPIVPSARRVDARQLSLARYTQDLEALFSAVRRSGARLLMATNARSYQRTQPAAEQARLAKTARFYNPCFDIDGLHTLYERHNDLIMQRAQAQGVAVARLHELVPGGAAYFADASHFNQAGDAWVAQVLADVLAQQRLAGTGDAP